MDAILYRLIAKSQQLVATATTATTATITTFATFATFTTTPNLLLVTYGIDAAAATAATKWNFYGLIANR